MQRKNKTIEGRVADTLLQEPKQITLGGKTYDIAPPTIATLAMASREIAELPKVDTEVDDNLAFKALNFAKDVEKAVRVIGILILGAKAIRDDENAQRKGVFARKGESVLDTLSDELLYNASPKELMLALSTLLNMMQVGDFFAFTASLSKVNILTPTTTAVTTASGQ